MTTTATPTEQQLNAPRARATIRNLAHQMGGERAGHADALVFDTGHGRTLTLLLAPGPRGMVEVQIDRIDTGDRTPAATARLARVMARYRAQDVRLGRNLLTANVPAEHAPQAVLHALVAEGVLTVAQPAAPWTADQSDTQSPGRAPARSAHRPPAATRAATNRTAVSAVQEAGI